MRQYRGNDIAMIFQEPMTSLNPVMKIGTQMNEVLIKHKKMSYEEATKESLKMLEAVGIPSPENRMNEYPHQFSGGMRQRVMIGMALQCNPALLIADEPTTALDVTIQAQILDLMMKLKDKRSDSAILLITHDLAVVAETCDRVIVMYGGQIQEISPVEELFKNPLHPYTKALMASIPHLDRQEKRLKALRGMVPSILEMGDGCKFCNRFDSNECPCAGTKENQELFEVKPEHWVRCHKKILNENN
jgi:oligopeptide/dipeptide ABC transporter ATP-binding protein